VATNLLRAVVRRGCLIHNNEYNLLLLLHDNFTAFHRHRHTSYSPSRLIIILILFIFLGSATAMAFAAREWY